MRVLVTTSGGAGHFVPLLPFLEAIDDTGDELLVVTRESLAEPVGRAGHAVRAFADADGAARAPFFERAHTLPPDEGNRVVVGEVFAKLDTAAALPGVLAACEEWRPDLVLSETCEFAGPIAAELLELPVARVGIGLGSTESMLLAIGFEALEDLRELHGLPRASPADTPFLTLVPPAMEDPRAPLVEHTLRYRERDAAPAHALPDWWDGDERPLVYLTFGSVAPQMQFFPGLYRAAIDALADVPARVLVTIGLDRDPGELGPLPANTHVESWVPQADVMPHAAALVCHGGFGTVRASLCAGIPLVVLPLFADQPYNAARAAALGAGITVAGGPPAASGLGAAVRELLADPAHADAAGRIAADVRGLPVVDEAVAVLQELVQDHARAPRRRYAPAR
jgi:UDP:flavonoid glycosyltransferase YjiC (YdhE family)